MSAIVHHVMAVDSPAIIRELLLYHTRSLESDERRLPFGDNSLVSHKPPYAQ